LETAVANALGEGTDVSVLFLNLGLLPEEKVPRQQEIVELLETEHPKIDFRFSEEEMPWRGTFINHSMKYDPGQAIFFGLRDGYI
jgi:hypothetical protein